MADASLDGLDGTLLFQRLGDESCPGRVRPDALGQSGFLGIAHKEVVHLLAGEGSELLAAGFLLGREN